MLSLRRYLMHTLYIVDVKTLVRSFISITFYVLTFVRSNVVRVVCVVEYSNEKHFQKNNEYIIFFCEFINMNNPTVLLITHFQASLPTQFAVRNCADNKRKILFCNSSCLVLGTLRLRIRYTSCTKRFCATTTNIVFIFVTFSYVLMFFF